MWTSSGSGRSLTLAFDSSGRLFSGTDGDGNTVTYCYFGQSCADGATDGGAYDLYSVVVPGGTTTVYGYDSSDSTPAYVHDILSESLPTGGTVTNIKARQLLPKSLRRAGPLARRGTPSSARRPRPGRYGLSQQVGGRQPLRLSSVTLRRFLVACNYARGSSSSWSPE